MMKEAQRALKPKHCKHTHPVSQFSQFSQLFISRDACKIEHQLSNRALVGDKLTNLVQLSQFSQLFNVAQPWLSVSHKGASQIWIIVAMQN